MTNRIALHPLCTAFPDMTPEEFDTLRESAAAIGIIEPVLIFEGKILDGRHRNAIAVELGIKCPEEQFNGDFAAAEKYVWAKNASRRNLDAGQRALARAKLRAIHEERAPGAPLPTLKADAAELGVSERTMKQAVRVVRSATPSVAKAVEKGNLSLKEAEKLVDLPRDAQDVVAGTPKPAPAPRSRSRSNTDGSMATPPDDTQRQPSTGRTWKPLVTPKPEVGASKEAVDELHERLEILTAENDRLTDENMALKQLVGDENQLAEVQSHIEQMRRDLERAERELLTMTESRDTYMREAGEAKSQCTYYRKRLQSLGKEL